MLREPEHEKTRRSKNSVIFTVGATAALQRRVCVFGFLANYPTSKPTLDRMIARKAAGLPAYDPRDSSTEDDGVAERVAQVKDKTLSIIGWWLAYADMASEKLPDADKLMTPHRYLCDIYTVQC